MEPESRLRFFLVNTAKLCINFFLSVVQTLFPFLKPRKSVKDDIILITGAGSGIGQLMSIEFAKLGAIIVAWDLNEKSLSKTKKLVEEAGSKCHTFKVDVTDRHKVYETAAKVKQEIGFVSMLINNAGIVIGKNLLDLEDEEIISTMNVNAISHFWTIKAFLPEMMEHNRGHIVTIASLAGTVGVNKLTDYCASKYAAVGLDASLRLELATNGYSKIKTTVVCPWFIDTGMFSGCAALLPVLEPKYVVDTVVNSILIDQAELIIPRSMYLMAFFKSFLPTKSARNVAVILGVDKSMDNFVGHNKKN